MVNLETSIHKDLSIIISKMKEADNVKDFDTLLGIYDVLNKIAAVNNIDPLESEIADELYQKYDIDNIVERLNRRIKSNYGRYYKFNKRFSNIVDDLKEVYYNNKYEKNINNTIDNKKIINYTRDFFKNYDNNIYMFLDDYLKYERLFFVNDLFDSNYGCIIECDRYMKPYTLIEKTDSIIDFVSLVHELIHIYFQYLEIDYTNEECIRRDLNNFREVYSSFIELIAMDYLKENSFDKQEIYSIKVDYDNDMIENLALYNKLLYKKKRYLKDLELLINIEKYSYGKVLAYHFYEQYKNDPNEAKNNIKQFSLDSKEYNKKYLLNNYGLNQVEVFSSKVLKKNIY